MKKLRPSNIKSHTLMSGIEKLRTLTLIHAFRHIFYHARCCTSFTAKPNGTPNSFPHVLGLQYSKEIYSHYTLLLATVSTPLSPSFPGHPADKRIPFHHHQKELQGPFAPRALQMEASLPHPNCPGSVSSASRLTLFFLIPGHQECKSRVLPAPHSSPPSSASSSREAHPQPPWRGRLPLQLQQCHQLDPTRYL